MADIWNLNALCRCCHKDGYFRSMQYPYVGRDGDVEVYRGWLKEVLGIIMESPAVQASEMICDECITSLRDAKTFKKQVTDCELRFQQYCRNEADVKVEAGQTSEEETKLLQGFDFSNFLQKEEDQKIKIKEEIVTIQEQENIDNTEHLNNNDDFNNDSDSEPLANKESTKKGKKKINKGVVKKSSHFGDKTAPPTTKTRIKPKSNKAKETQIQIVQKTLSKPGQKSRSPNIAKTGQKSLQSLRCKQCGLYLRDPKALYDHRRMVHKGEERINKMDITCVFCRDIVRGIVKYKTHIKQTHPGKGTVCNYCPEIFIHREHMRNHVKNNHKLKEKYECDYCHKEFLSKRTLRNHIISHMDAVTGTSGATCNICGFRLKNKYYLKYHVIQVHENIRAFQCNYCPKNYKTKKALKEHTGTKHTYEKPYDCTQCDNKFVSRHTLLKHIDSKHKDKVRKIVKKDGEAIPLWKRIYKCFVCKEAFQGRTTYRKHLRKEHDGMMPFQCHICAKSFTTNFCLLRHLYRHDNSKMIKCELCPKVFKHQLFVKEHINRTHGNTNRDGTPKVGKPDHVKCDICNKYVQHLDKHKQAHYKRPFKCSLCERDYSLRSGLKRHMNDHLKLMVHSCDICDAKFMKANSIVRHKQRKHPEVSQRNVNQGEYHQKEVNQIKMKVNQGEDHQKEVEMKVNQGEDHQKEVEMKVIQGEDHQKEVEMKVNQEINQKIKEFNQTEMKSELDGYAGSLEGFNVLDIKYNAI